MSTQREYGVAVALTGGHVYHDLVYIGDAWDVQVSGLYVEEDEPPPPHHKKAMQWIRQRLGARERTS